MKLPLVFLAGCGIGCVIGSLLTWFLIVRAHYGPWW
jgi:hypothetical protein